MPTREIAIYDESFEAAIDLTTKQYFGVKLHTVVGQVTLAGAGEAIGVLQNKPNVGESAQVRLFGLSRMVMAGVHGGPASAIVLTSDANGKGIADSIGDLALGRAVEPSTGADEVRTILLIGLVRRHA